jgi:hypothetical protein
LTSSTIRRAARSSIAWVLDTAVTPLQTLLAVRTLHGGRRVIFASRRERVTDRAMVIATDEFPCLPSFDLM